MGTFSINVSLQCQSRRNLSLSYSQVSQQSKYNLNYSHTNTPLNNTVITKTDDLLIILNPYRHHFLTVAQRDFWNQNPISEFCDLRR